MSWAAKQQNSSPAAVQSPGSVAARAAHRAAAAFTEQATLMHQSGHALRSGSDNLPPYGQPSQGVYADYGVCAEGGAACGAAGQGVQVSAFGGGGADAGAKYRRHKSKVR